MVAILCQDLLQWGINLLKWVRAGTDQLGFLLQGRNGVGKQIEQINFATDWVSILQRIKYDVVGKEFLAIAEN